MGKTGSRYVVCIQSDGAEDLEFRKVYRVVPDQSASARGYLRVVDESGEDYVYPAKWFVGIEVSEEAERAIGGASPKPASRTHQP